MTNRRNTFARRAAFCSSLIGLMATAAWAGSDPPDAFSLSFRPATFRVLPGTSGEKNRGWNCSGVVDPADQIGRVAIVATLYQNGCYGDGRYNHGDYKVEQGVVVDATGGASYDAYRVHAPSKKASSFLGSKHQLFYKFPDRRAYSVFRLEAGTLSKAAAVSAADTDPMRFVKLGVEVSSISGTVVYVIVPSARRLSSLTRIGKGVEAARILGTTLGDVFTYRYQVGGVPFDTRTGFPYGPITHQNVYSYPRQFFPVRRASGGLSVVWQDQKSKAVHVTALAADLKSHSTKTLPNPGGLRLAAAAGDGANCVFYLFVEDGNGARTSRARRARLVKADMVRGVVVKQAELDTSKRGLDIAIFGTKNVASMVHAGGQLGLIVSRSKNRSRDGLNHQGAIAVVFDATTLSVVRNLGQTSGHSFESVLTVNKAGEFLGIDLGDNYPRGVNLHKFTSKRRRSAVVYTFKTQHGRRAVSPAGRSYPSYPEISGNGTRYFKWSNDNRTYTEIGGIAEQGSGYTIVFSGESANGRALDNARVGTHLNDPRNIGLVRVRSDFDRVRRRGDVVADDLVLSSGPAEVGGFFTFGGRWSPQRNKGVVWLTGYRDSTKANASRVKAVGLASGAVLVLWEKWTPTSYVSTYAMKIGPSGKKLAGPVELGARVRLNRRDDPWVRGNTVYLVAGDRVGSSLEVIQIRVK